MRKFPRSHSQFLSARSAAALTLVLAAFGGGPLTPSVAPSAIIAQDLPTLTPDDYGRWESLGLGVLSPDGRWLAVSVSRVNDDDELRIHRTDSDSLVVVPFGTRQTFNDDGGWLAYLIGQPEGDEDDAESRKRTLGLFNLDTGTEEQIEGIASFAFSEDGRFIALTRQDEEGRAGSDVLVRDLDDGTHMSFGNVSDMEWADGSSLLAMVLETEGGAGNGVRLYDAGTGRIWMLDAQDAEYSGLTWREDSQDLAVMRTHPQDGYTDTTHVVLAWRDLGEAEPNVVVLEADEGSPVPADMRVAEYRSPEWSDDGETIFLGLQARDPTDDDGADEDAEEEGETGTDEDAAEEGETEAEGDEEGDVAGEEEEDDPPGVEVWHSLDVDPIPQQRVRESQLRRVSHVAAWHLDNGALIVLGGDHADRSTVIGGGSHLLARDETPYDVDAMFRQQRHDLYTVDAETGERVKVHEGLTSDYGASPEGEYLLWFEGEDYWTHEIATGETRNVTANLAGTFVNLDVTPTRDQMPPFGIAGWLEDDRAVLIHDRYDIWSVAPDGSGGRRLTDGASDSVRHRIVRLDREADAFERDSDLYLTTSGEWTKRSGFARVSAGGRSVETLMSEDASLGRLIKAEDADVYAFVRERWEDSPDYFVADTDLDGESQVTATNLFQSEFAWGRTELIEYENEWGRRLQGSLIYPAAYEPGQTYPMIVYHYEQLSQLLHRYAVPNPEDYYNFQVWSQEGYFVLLPDIVYRDRRPGQSNVETLRPAVAAALETGMIDEERVGLIGHSWGGYQTTFFVTQDDLFASAVAGAPLTNLMSMYLSFYWNTGGTDARIFEISQGRMQVPWWEDWDSYHANSPIHHIENLNTPLLIEFGTDDGAVEFNQGVEFYNAARRAGKHVVMLVYEGENHGLAKEPNQRDYHSRILQWFGHYLKGEPAPDWISKGVPYLEQKDGLKRKPRIIS